MASSAILAIPAFPYFYKFNQIFIPSPLLPQERVLSPISYLEYSLSWKRYSAPDVFAYLRIGPLSFTINIEAWLGAP